VSISKSEHVYCTDCVCGKKLIDAIYKNTDIPKTCSGCEYHNPEDSMMYQYRPNYKPDYKLDRYKIYESGIYATMEEVEDTIDSMKYSGEKQQREVYKKRHALRFELGRLKNELNIQPYIYTITTFQRLNKMGNFGSIRCVGYYTNFEDAKNAVENNWGDIFETTYNYALIEEVRPGLYPMALKRWLYKIETDENNYIGSIYIPINEPNYFKTVINFAIG